MVDRRCQLLCLIVCLLGLTLATSCIVNPVPTPGPYDLTNNKTDVKTDDMGGAGVDATASDAWGDTAMPGGTDSSDFADCVASPEDATPTDAADDATATEDEDSETDEVSSRTP
jgi:hypothetical protein